MNRRTLPVLTRKRIPGRAPWLAGRLRAVAERIEALADRIDDRYTWAEPELTYEEFSSTVTFGDFRKEGDGPWVSEGHDA